MKHNEEKKKPDLRSFKLLYVLTFKPNQSNDLQLYLIENVCLATKD